MLTIDTWIRDFIVTDEDIDYLNTLLLEREIPLNSRTLASAVVRERIRLENQKLQSRFKDARLYNPADSFEVGQRVVFSKFDYALGTVTSTREGENNEYPDPFTVIAVEFDDKLLNTGKTPREFAANLTAEHPLNTAESDMPTQNNLTPDDIIQHEDFDLLIDKIDETLQMDNSLIQVAGQWFAKELIIETNEGHMHLAEAILDMMGGGPLTTPEILENIGGIGNEKQDLQIFSMNYAMNKDSRFDEVGPAGEVLWYLKRMEPQQVQETPAMLRYTPIDYDRSSLDKESIALEHELADEHSPIPVASSKIEEARVTLIYPHRRCGTLPINYQAARIFPTARKTERVAVTLIDAKDNEAYSVWVVRRQKYVHGLMPLYTKHALPIGTTVTLKRGVNHGEIIIDFESHRPRSEWITIVNAEGRNISFENAQRGIGATYDELLLLGVDNLQGVDKLFQNNTNQQQPLATILRTIIPLLGKLSAQGHVHTKTLYSAVNIIRRCPPGPLMATLINNPDFENVGGHFWKLS